MNTRESQLILQARAGVSDAMESLYHSHVGHIRAYFARCGFRPPDDPTREVFLLAMRSLETYDQSRGDFAGWLSDIARDVALKQWRRREPPANFDPELAEQTFASPTNPHESPEQIEELTAVRECVAALPPRLAVLAHLRYVEGRTARGLAEATGLAESTVRQRLDEARGLLRRCLNGKGFSA